METVQTSGLESIEWGAKAILVFFAIISLIGLKSFKVAFVFLALYGIWDYVVKLIKSNKEYGGDKNL